MDCLRRDTVHRARAVGGRRLLAYASDDRIVVAEGSTPSELDARFASLVKQADVGGRAQPHHGGRPDAGAARRGVAGAHRGAGRSRRTSTTRVPSTKPPLHARLRLTLDERIEDEEHWGFRAISSNHPGAVMSRVMSASTMAGLDSTVPKRRLFLLRNGGWPTGPKTTETINIFHSRGGQTFRSAREDLQVFEALRIMQSEQDGGLAEWLATRKPASCTALFQAARRYRRGPDGPVAEPFVVRRAAADLLPPTRGSRSTPATARRPGSRMVAGAHRPPRLGRTTRRRRSRRRMSRSTVDLDALRRHTVIFAGSGSGKTVLIRRLVEECALQGRLGDRARPEQRPGPTRRRLAGAAARAGPPMTPPRPRDYLAHTDVVVWTPGLEYGRPLTFQPLPDFERGPRRPGRVPGRDRHGGRRAGAHGPQWTVRRRRPQQGQAVLREALSYYARQRRDGGLRAFVGILADLPDDVTQIGKGQRDRRRAGGDCSPPRWSTTRSSAATAPRWTRACC